MENQTKDQQFINVRSQLTELEQKTQNLWKNFGRENEVGKLLFTLYKSGKPAQINYPKPKTKPFDPNPPKGQGLKQKQNPVHKNRQQTILSQNSKKFILIKLYLFKKKNPKHKFKKFHIYFQEIDAYYAKPYIPINRGKDRARQINDLQQRFKYSYGILPEKASLPVDELEVKKILNDPTIKEKAKQKFLQKQKEPKQEIQKNDEEQLNELFQQILEEIEERQEFLKTIDHLKEPEMKKRIKQEIVERVSELQKVTELQKKILKN